MVLNLSEHPDARQAQNKTSLAKAKKQVNLNLRKLELLQPRINRRYERFEELIRNRDARRASEVSDKPPEYQANDLPHRPSQNRVPSDPVTTEITQPLTADDNKDLAVQLAHKEIRRRATARKATRQAGISEEIESERRTAGLWGNWEDDLTQNDNKLDRDTLSKQMQSVRSQVHGSSSLGKSTVNSHLSVDDAKAKFRYPTVPDHKAPQPRRIPSFTPDSPTSSPSPEPPQPPPKVFDNRHEREAPTLPVKERPSQHSSESSSIASERKDLEPSALTFKPSAYLENGTPLRTIFLPPNLRHKFLSIAEPNTRANLETCGILCGTLISNALFISKLVVPEQKSTSDTCETMNESDLFDYIDGEDLMILGWIHTHPTQTCFMSSRDLHTHGGYQVMMPESIAIVCAPSKGEWGVFRLTDPPGMKTVLNCTQTGLFHPHSESNIYTDALRPGHVFEAKGLEFDVVDMRP